jgi:hypothetical protein
MVCNYSHSLFFRFSLRSASGPENDFAISAPRLFTASYLHTMRIKIRERFLSVALLVLVCFHYVKDR